MKSAKVCAKPADGVVGRILPLEEIGLGRGTGRDPRGKK